MATRVPQYFCFPDKPIKVGHLGFLERGGGESNLRKGGVDLEKGGMTPPPLPTMHGKKLAPLVFHLSASRKQHHQTCFWLHQPLTELPLQLGAIL